MNLGQFASNDVGLKIAPYHGDRKARVRCLVLDWKDSGGLNGQNSNSVTFDHVFFSDQLSSEDSLQTIRDLELDLIVLAWWPYIVKPPVIALAKQACLNFHNGFLPYNRGKHPNFWSIVEQTPYGGTLHFVDEGIDTGDIVFQTQVPTDWNDTGGTLHEKGKTVLVRLFKEKYDDLVSGRFARIAQDPDPGPSPRAKELEPNSRIDPDRSYNARDLLNLLRARTYPPDPAA